MYAHELATFAAPHYRLRLHSRIALDFPSTAFDMKVCDACNRNSVFRVCMLIYYDATVFALL